MRKAAVNFIVCSLAVMVASVAAAQTGTNLPADPPKGDGSCV
jgi:hypothetical protein